jgi:hypothetical protein
LAARGEAKRLEENCEARIRTCKQNAARTGSEQAADLCRVFFPVIKLFQKRTTLKDQSTPPKQLINTAFDQLRCQDKLFLKRFEKEGNCGLCVMLAVHLIQGMHSSKHSTGIDREWHDRSRVQVTGRPQGYPEDSPENNKPC